MRSYLFIPAIFLMLVSPVFAQLFPEPVFGLEGGVYRWGWQYDDMTFNLPFTATLGKPSGAANIRIADNTDTSDIIILIDSGSWLGRWYRIGTNESGRILEHVGLIGLAENDSPNLFKQPSSIAVSSIGNLYDSDEDRIYIANRLGHSLYKLNFIFDSQNPGGDQWIIDEEIYIDSMFFPVDLEYIDFNTGFRGDNKLIALDDIGNRLVVFSDGGTLLNQIYLSEFEDTLTHIYSAFTHKVINNSTVFLYLADENNSLIKLFRFNLNSQIEYIRDLCVDDRLETDLSDIVYNPRFGLWAIENMGPHFYKLAENLSRVLFEINIENFGIDPLIRPYKISSLTNRIVIFEEMSDETGIISLGYQPHFRKAVSENDVPIPYEYSLRQNYPNPFNPNTIISFSLAEPGYASIAIYNILGQKVAVPLDKYLDAGDHALIWDGRNVSGEQVSSGIYFYRIQSGDFEDKKKMLLLR